MSPRGKRARVAPKPERRVVVVRPARQAPELRTLLAKAVKGAAKFGLPATTYRAKPIHFRGEGVETVASVLAPEDATALYRLAHRSLVLVLAPASIVVRRDPSVEPPTRRHTLLLETFVQHKCLHWVVNDERDIDTALQQLATWPESAGCNGENDPRVLPLHVFDTNRDWSGLPDDAVARRFADRHGAGSRRCDDGNKAWTRTKEYHAGPPLYIGGTQLHAGMHWDVRSVAGKATLKTSGEVWHLAGRSAYLNVFPDAAVQKSDGRSTARQVWPRPR